MNEIELIAKVRQDFRRMLVDAESMKIRASGGRSALAYQFADQMALEAERALEELDRQEAELRLAE